MTTETLLEECKGLCTELESRQLAFVFYISGRRKVVLSPQETHEAALAGKQLGRGPTYYVSQAVALYHRWLDAKGNLCSI